MANQVYQAEDILRWMDDYRANLRIEGELYNRRIKIEAQLRASFQYIEPAAVEAFRKMDIKSQSLFLRLLGDVCLQSPINTHLLIVLNSRSADFPPETRWLLKQVADKVLSR